MQRIGFIIPEGFQMLALAPQTVFEYANRSAGRTVYDVKVLSEKGRPLRSTIGITLQTERFSGQRFDTLIFGGTNEATPRLTPGLLSFARRALENSRRVAAMCAGAFVLAEAGLLDGRRATTHWAFSRELQTRFPNVTVEEDRIFVVDGPVWTSAGGTAALDLALAMVEKDLGADVARSTAHLLVMHHRRAGGQRQHSELLTLSPKSDRIQNAIAYAEKHLNTELSVGRLAEVANLSPRQFSRAFHNETGQSPAKAVEKMRLESARFMIEQSRHPIQVVAHETGFADPRRMREAFLRTFGLPPQAFRRNARENRHPLQR